MCGSGLAVQRMLSIRISPMMVVKNRVVNDSRVLRGGSWRSDSSRRALCLSRLAMHPGYRGDDLRFSGLLCVPGSRF